MVVAVVVHGPQGAVGLVQRVHAVHHVAVATLVLRLHVARVVVLHLVVERVLGMRLKCKYYQMCIQKLGSVAKKKTIRD